MTTLTADPQALTGINPNPNPAPAVEEAPNTAVTYGLVVTINRYRPEAYEAITGTLKKYYDFGKFFTWDDGIESTSELTLPDKSHLPWTIESMVDHIRNLNAWPDPDRRIYCKVTFQIFEAGKEAPLQEFRY
jgi:hypothetical protein